jgi:cytosol alanyl aminopeptidase
MRLARPIVLAFAASLLACPGAPPPEPKPLPLAPPPAPEPVPAAREDGRLPAIASPVSYALDLVVDPTQPKFRGVVKIDLEVAQRSSHLVLHAHAIEIASAKASYGPPNGRVERAAKTTMRLAQGGVTPEELVLTFDEPLPAGRIALEIAYSARFDNELSGLYRVKDGDGWYAFTQFEATDARRAFPCFDDPMYKVPFTVALTTPPGMIAVANTPEAKRMTPQGGPPGGTRFEFAPTPPLPSYLVAFAVGNFDVREMKGRTEKPPIRIVTTKGKTEGHGDLALEATAGLLKALEEYFGIPYPYAKLDIVAVPDFAAGAMENPGLITFREERLLLDPQRASVGTRRGQALVVAHELAHQWFGDLVTASWWNDLWLNEGMATWIEWRVVDKWKPELGAKNDAFASALGIMDLDSLESARAIRQPVSTTGEAHEAFDGITYEKGAAVLATIERWVGPETFRRGIQSYLVDNQWKSVQADKLLTALDRQSGKDVTQMASGYLDKPGVPLVDVHVECQSGRWHAELTQEPWRPLGAKVPETDDRVWTIPVCTRTPGDKQSTCADLAFGAPSLVAGKGKCPSTIHPNVDGSYYRFILSDKQFVALGESKKELDVPARLSLLSNAWAAVRAGKSDPKTIVKLLPMFDDDNTRHVVEQIIGILWGADKALVDEDARPAFKKFVAARLAKRKKDLGWLPKPGAVETDLALARRMVLSAMGDLAEDDATLKEADDLAVKWLADPASVDSDTAAVAVDLASRRADASRLTALREAAKKAKSREDRTVALRAMGGFDDPAILSKALELVLTDEIRVAEIRYVLGAAFARRKMQPTTEEWVRTHWDDLRKRLPGSLGNGLVAGAGVGCTKEAANERAAFYTPRAKDIEGAARPLAESLEIVTLCSELRRHGASAFGKALAPAK